MGRGRTGRAFCRDPSQFACFLAVFPRSGVDVFGHPKAHLWQEFGQGLGADSPHRGEVVGSGEATQLRTSLQYSPCENRADSPDMLKRRGISKVDGQPTLTVVWQSTLWAPAGFPCGGPRTYRSGASQTDFKSSMVGPLSGWPSGGEYFGESIIAKYLGDGLGSIAERKI